MQQVNTPLNEVMRLSADHGLGFSLQDATSTNRYIDPALAEKYVACFERHRPTRSAVDIFAVPNSEECPIRIGEEGPRVETPSVIGTSVRTAAQLLTEKGYHPHQISVESDRPLESKTKRSDHNWNLQVCEQSIPAGTEFTADAKLQIIARIECSDN
ncbi:PASTA domain-containing protein [Streptomyces albidoflavus]